MKEGEENNIYAHMIPQHLCLKSLMTIPNNTII